MGITAKKTVEREIVPAGSYPARCIKIIHFGHVPDNYMGEKRIVDKVRFTWELPTETRVFDEDLGEQPILISKDYTVSLGDKANLRHDLEAWRGKAFTLAELAGFDITNVIGALCMLNIIHRTSKKTDNDYAIVAGISPMPKGIKCPEQVNPYFIWDYEEHFDEKILENMHQWFQDIIKSSEEYKEKAGKKGKKKEEDPDIPDAPMPTAEDAPVDVEYVDDLPF
jgi:hypothetical protein